MNEKDECQTNTISEIKGRVSAICFIALNEWAEEEGLNESKLELLTTWINDSIRKLPQTENNKRTIQLPKELLKDEKKCIIQILKDGVEKYGFRVEYINFRCIKIYKTRS